jgi:hypothetical protein
LLLLLVTALLTVGVWLHALTMRPRQNQGHHWRYFMR